MTVPPDPRAPYVDPAELATVLGVDPADPRVVRVANTTSSIIDAYYGVDTVAAKLVEPPWPDAVVEAALTIGQDVWRRPSTPGGYFQVADFVGRLSADPTNPVTVLLDSIGREWWPIA